VTLEPLEERHVPGLREAAADERIWRWMITTDVEAWIRAALAATDMYHFAVLRDGVVVGSTSYLNVVPEHRRLEIGNTWNNPSTWGTGANTDAKYLLLRHAFETLGSSSRPTRRTNGPGPRSPPSRRSSRASTGSTCSSAGASGETPRGTPSSTTTGRT
jgi:Acetyltransferase (GNAT) domain